MGVRIKPLQDVSPCILLVDYDGLVLAIDHPGPHMV